MTGNLRFSSLFIVSLPPQTYLLHFVLVFSNEGDAIKVFVRIRPPAEGPGPSDGEHSLCLSVLSPTTLRLHSNPDPKTFVFDYVAGMDTTQVVVIGNLPFH